MNLFNTDVAIKIESIIARSGAEQLETFIAPKELVKNPHYQEHRQKSLSVLTDDVIDAPIIEHIYCLNKLPYCFTIQSCYGHFLYNDQKDPTNFDPLPITNTIVRVEYRIAYIAFCIDNNDPGRKLFDTLNAITAIDPENIQFGCAEWFWKSQVNSYALQVEPERFKDKDQVTIDYREALRVQDTRDSFFYELGNLLC